MFIEERHQAILDLLEQQGRISTAEIQQRFMIGYDSAKRDLRILEEKGLLKRTHGGAIPLHQVAAGKPAKTTPKDINEVRPNYLAIALKALSMLENNDVIYLPSATLGYFMAKHLPDSLTLRVVTNSITIAEELRPKDHISVLLLGGEMDHKGNCYDAIAIETLKRLRLDKCFITSACISPRFGLSIQRTQAISFYNTLIDSAKQTIGLYPTEKIGQDSIVSICPANRLDILITDWDASEEDLKEFDEQGIEIVIIDQDDADAKE
ncbi:MAG: DeoR/GlpR transcriptional regulator [Lachnospiraceae bacterium]|nr:DeoR/GlpR transcriptional regulator [Lachnospiraceae bacterium]